MQNPRTFTSPIRCALLALATAALACGSGNTDKPANANSASGKDEAVGTNITLELPAGDIANGEKLAKAKACTACHLDSPTGPAWWASAYPSGEGIGTRAASRLAQADYAGQATTPEQYLFESIVAPSAYIVPDESTYGVNGTSAMPSIYGQQFSKQEVADLIAYLLTMK